MEFILDKTQNDFDDDGNILQPHKDAYQKRYDRIEVRTLYSEADFDKRFGDSEGVWRRKGIDHTKTAEGYIQRRHIADNESWFVRIETLQDLLDFIDANGTIVLSKKDELPAIEIYNGYRE